MPAAAWLTLAVATLGSSRLLHRAVPPAPLLRMCWAPDISRPRSVAAPRIAAPPPAACPTERGLELYDAYDASIQLLLDEIAATSAGDRIELGLYLLEGGQSSEQILAALACAGADRGVRVSFGVDVSYVSMISRLTEKTDTLIPRVTALAQRHPEWCSVSYKPKPDHAKYALFLRQEASLSSAILGGMNLGDRFREWRDYTVRLPAENVEQLCRCLWGGDGAARPSFAHTTVTPPCGIALSSERSATPATDRALAEASRAAITGVLASAILGWFFLPAALLGPLAATLSGGHTASLNLAAAISGAAFTTGLGIATDGWRFNLPREIAQLARALIFDRSRLGDALAPLRPTALALSGISGVAPAPIPVLAPTAISGVASMPISGIASAPVSGATPAAISGATPAAISSVAPARILGVALAAIPSAALAVIPGVAATAIPAMSMSGSTDVGGARSCAVHVTASPLGIGRSGAGPPIVSGLSTSERAIPSADFTPAQDLRFSHLASLPTGGGAVSFASNRRDISRYQIEPAFRSLFSDARFRHYRVAMAYVGPRWGVEIIQIALRRGAAVDLLLPARANVYAAANLQAAQALLDGGWPNLRIWFHREMVHAKAVLASAGNGGVSAWGAGQAAGADELDNRAGSLGHGAAAGEVGNASSGARGTIMPVGASGAAGVAARAAVESAVEASNVGVGVWGAGQMAGADELGNGGSGARDMGPGGVGPWGEGQMGGADGVGNGGMGGRGTGQGAGAGRVKHGGIGTRGTEQGAGAGAGVAAEMAASGAPMPQGAGLDLSSPPLRVALLGSANLVRGSMNLPVWLDLLPYDELNVCVSEPRFCASLDASMNELWADADELDSNAQLLSGEEWAELHEAVRYSKWRAEWEELWQ